MMEERTTLMNVVILSRDDAAGTQLKNCLMDTGQIGCCCLTKTVSQAARAVRKLNACCLYFERGFAQDFESFFARIGGPHIFFVVLSETRGSDDALEALNTGRVADYLVHPIQPEMVEKSVANLCWRVRHSNIIFLPCAQNANEGNGIFVL